MIICSLIFIFFFFNDTATTEIYTLSLHDALPISCRLVSKFSHTSSFRQSAEYKLKRGFVDLPCRRMKTCKSSGSHLHSICYRSEEHTSELQSRSDLVCRLLLEKKKNKTILLTNIT